MHTFLKDLPKQNWNLFLFFLHKWAMSQLFQRATVDAGSSEAVTDSPRFLALYS